MIPLLETIRKEVPMSIGKLEQMVNVTHEVQT